VQFHRGKLMADTLPYLATPVWRVCAEVRKRGCQAILCQEYEHARFDLSVLAGALAGVPVFATFQGGDTRYSRLENVFRRMTIEHSAGLIIGSARERERVAGVYRGSVRKVAAICNPLDLSLWYPENRTAARRALELPENALLVMWHGRVDMWRKGLDRLAEAWSEIARTRPRGRGRTATWCWWATGQIQRDCGL
jgi:starch synthase